MTRSAARSPAARRGPGPRRLRSAPAAALFLAAAAAGSWGCATADFDRHYEAERYGEAVEAFRSDSSSLADDRRALFRAAVARLLAAGGTGDERRARQLFGRLLKRFPESTYAPQSRAFVAQIDRRAELREELERARREEAVLRGRVVHVRDRLASAEGRGDSLSTRLAELRNRLREREETCSRLREELERLKTIDLERPPEDP